MKIKNLLGEESSSPDIEKYKNIIKNTEYYRHVLKPEIDRYINDNKPSLDSEGAFKWISKFKDYSRILYHGTTKRTSVDIISFKERENPKDTVTVVHKYVNKLASEVYNVNVRNGMFASIERDMVGAYGSENLLIPLGNYSVYFVPNVSDFTDEHRVSYHDEFDASMFDRILDSVFEDIENQESEISTRIRNGDYESDSMNVEDFLIEISLVKNDLQNIRDIYMKDDSLTFDGIYDEVEHITNEALGNLKKYSMFRDVFKDTILQSTKSEINSIKSELDTYMTHMTKTTSLDNIRYEELMVWFDRAILLNTNDSKGLQVLSELIIEAKNENT